MMMAHNPAFLRSKISELTLADEEACVRALIPLARLPVAADRRAREEANAWATLCRKEANKKSGMEKLLHRFRLTDKEGVALMALAEALPRITDDPTADALITDKLSQGDWRHYLAHYPDLVSKVAWLGLTLGKDVSQPRDDLVGRLSASALREAMRIGMKKLGEHFVMGNSIEQAITRSLKKRHALERFSFDMLGESARTAQDADAYFNDYKNAIIALSYAKKDSATNLFGPSVSVKLSALHPRYEWAQRERVLAELTPRLIELVELAAQHHTGLTIDAEDGDRFDLSCDVLERLFGLAALKHYHGFGCAVQAYQKRAPAVIDWLYALAEKYDLRMTVRLVKGAYWDTEIKRAQERGLSGYPVYTRKEATDIAYLACAKKLLGMRTRIFPQFATHNIATLAALKEMAGDKDFEVQRLLGMGDDAHMQMLETNIPSCVYAPVGTHDRLLSYLIRRLMENSANSGFVNQLYHDDIGLENLLASPIEKWEWFDDKPHPAIPLPAHIFGKTRINSSGRNLFDPDTTRTIEQKLNAAQKQNWQAGPIMAGVKHTNGQMRDVVNPANSHHIIGQCLDAVESEIPQAFTQLTRAFPSWTQTPVATRALPFTRLASKLEEVRDELAALLCFEAGKTIGDAQSEIREAIDFCRYYTYEAQRLLTAPTQQHGISGEQNMLGFQGRGVFVCISPWNFPLAIFLGQISAALLAGNVVLAKPAEQTPLVAARTIELLLGCGLPSEVIALLPGDAALGTAIMQHPDVAGVAFTGSIHTARHINRVLAAKDGPIVPLIAETGGVNALIADASALPEQLVDDVIASAFRSAGQRCSAARLLCVEESIADKVITMLRGALAELHVGNPAQLACDVGPVIDAKALARLSSHEQRLKAKATLIAKAPVHSSVHTGTYCAPQAWEISSPFFLHDEVFGPIVHIVRFKGHELPLLIDQINALGYGLTGGLHSRIDRVIAMAKKNWRVGNLYINRSTIGAVVESQPFGGMGLSGTGPKAGGPHYLTRFVTEMCMSENLSASGGSIDLLGLG